jgi:hypothetical protein
MLYRTDNSAGSSSLSAFGRNRRLTGQVANLDAEPANDQDKRRQITFATSPISLNRPLHRLVRQAPFLKSIKYLNLA